MPRDVRKPHGPYQDDFGSYYLLPLTRGLEAKISPEDVGSVSAFNWCASLESRGTKNYAIRWAVISGRRFKVRLHHFVLGLPLGWGCSGDLVVDHIGHDSLDCRRNRLEIITQEENMRRSGGWKKKGMKIEEPFL